MGSFLFFPVESVLVEVGGRKLCGKGVGVSFSRSRWQIATREGCRG